MEQQALLYRQLDKKERLRDMYEFLRWLLRINKGNVIKVSTKQYNRWPGGYAPLGPPDAVVFNRLFAELKKKYGIRAKEKYVVKRGKYTRHRHWLVRRSQLEKLVKLLGEELTYY